MMMMTNNSEAKINPEAVHDIGETGEHHGAAVSSLVEEVLQEDATVHMVSTFTSQGGIFLCSVKR